MRPSSALAFSPGAAGPLLCPDTPWDWTLLAECQYTDPEVFFPQDPGESAAAKRVCRACPVRAECLAYALANGERYGVWGGLSQRELRRQPRPATAPDRHCRKRLHVLAGANTASDGRCLACKRDSEAARRAAGRAARTGSSSPQPGRRLAA
jgi:hypothetical protein